MSHGAAAAGAAVNPAIGAAVAVAQATKAFGPIVHVDAENFLTIIALNDAPLVVHATGGWLTTTHRYLTSYRGLFFYHKGKSRVTLPEGCGLIEASKLSIPDM